MRVILPQSVASNIIQALEKAGNREAGGILMGEHIADNIFKIRKATFEGRMGSATSFIRSIGHFLRPLQCFFKETNYNYERFNYLGEWHSHPLSTVRPSMKDCETMWDIVNDISVGARFVVLLIVRLDSGIIDGSVTVFLPGRECHRATLVLEG